MRETQPAVQAILDNQAKRLHRAAQDLDYRKPATVQRFLAAVEQIHAETLDRIRKLTPEQLLDYKR
jgi:hypothetical protein